MAWADYMRLIDGESWDHVNKRNDNETYVAKTGEPK